MKFSKIIMIVSIMLCLGLYTQHTVYYERFYKPMVVEMDSLRNELELNSMVNYIQIQEIDSLEHEITALKTPKWIPVVGTTYNPVKEQCDATPDILADGTKINVWRATEYKYIAVSQNMLTRNGGHLNFNDYVWIDAVKKNKRGEVIYDHSGMYQVKDVMNKRYTNRIDFLQTPGDQDIVYWDAKMLKIDVMG